MKSPAFSFYVRDWLCSPTVAKLHSLALCNPSKGQANAQANTQANTQANGQANPQGRLLSRGLNAYFFLLCQSWIQEPAASLPDDDLELAELARVTPEEWAEMRGLILPQFPLCEDGRRRNERLYEELVRQLERQSSGSKGGRSRVANLQANTQANLQAKPQAKRKPSSSSSSSSSLSVKILVGSSLLVPDTDLNSSLPATATGPSTKILKEFSPRPESESLAAIDSNNEEDAVRGMRDILGPDVFEGTPERVADGGKWRENWREKRSKVVRVFAELVATGRLGHIQAPGALAATLWKEFQ